MSIHNSIEIIKNALGSFWGVTPKLQFILYIALILIIYSETNKEKKLVFGWFSLLVILLLFNPITAAAMFPFFGTSVAYYCRFFLIIPIPIITAYGLTIGLTKLKSLMKLLLIVLFSFVIITRGHYIYNEPEISKSINFANVPNDVYQLSNLLAAYPGYKKVLVSSKISKYVRLVDASIILPFSRADLGNKISNKIESDAPDVNGILNYIRDNNCDYFMVKTNNSSVSAFLESGSILIGYTDNYAVLKDDYHSPIRTYDKLGNISSVTYIDSSGNPILQPKGYVTISYEYDINGRKIKESYLDFYGNLVMTLDGFAVKGYSYDIYNKPVEISYYDIDNNLVINADGYAIETHTYDSYHHETEVSYLDADRKPVFVDRLGYASIRMQKTLSDDIEKIMFYDENNKPSIQSKGYCGFIQKFDDNNYNIECTYLDSEEKPVIISDGYATIRRERDDKGNIISVHYFDESNQSIAINDRSYGYYLSYNDFNQILRQTYVDNKDNPIIITLGYATLKYEYDDKGNVISTHYYDEYDNPIASDNGAYGFISEYNFSNKVIKQTYIDADNKPTMLKSGYSIIEYEWNEKGYAIAEYYFDTDNNPVCLPNGQHGRTFKYNDDGKTSEIVYLGIDGDSILLTSGFSKIVYERTTSGMLIAKSYYDLDGNLVKKENVS